MKKYFSAVIAALIVGALVIAGFIYSTIKTGDETEIGGSKSGVVKLSPGVGVPTPKSAPSVVPPTTPPPSK